MTIHPYNQEDHLFNNFDLTYYNLLSSIKSYFLQQNLKTPFLNKDIIMYDHPALKDMSEHAIITDSFIFINEDAFKEMINSHTLTPFENDFLDYEKKISSLLNSALSEKLNSHELLEYLEENNISANPIPNEQIRSAIEELPIIQFIKSLTSYEYENKDNYILENLVKTPFVYLSDNNFLDYLQDSHLNNVAYALRVEINNADKSYEDFQSALDFSKQHREYLINFKEKKIPVFIFNYNALLLKNDPDNAQLLLEYFVSNMRNDIKNFSPLSFGLALHTLYTHDEDSHNLFINDPDFRDKVLNLMTQKNKLTPEKTDELINSTVSMYSESEAPYHFLLMFLTHKKNPILKNKF